MASTNFLLLLLALPAFVCGYPRPMLSIDGGAEPTEPNQYPWMVALRVIARDGVGRCGSALVRLPGNNDSSDIVLTAAHCVITSDDINDTSPSKVEEVIIAYAGGHIWKDIQQAETSTVSRAEVHPKYTAGVSPYDIAILKLSKPLKFDAEVQGIELPQKGHILPSEEEKCIIAGWGLLTHKGAQRPESLMHMNVNIASESQCSQIVNGMMNRRGNMIEDDQSRLYCVYAGTWENTKPSSCHGDSGGPLFCKDLHNNWTTHGVASGGIGCDANPSTGRGHPSFYVKLDGHLAWINEKIEALSSV